MRGRSQRRGSLAIPCDWDASVAAISNLTYDVDGNLDEAYVVGDMNCDGTVNPPDISAFSLAVSDPEDYESTYPVWCHYSADRGSRYIAVGSCPRERCRPAPLPSTT